MLPLSAPDLLLYFLFELVFNILICFLFRMLFLPLFNSWFKLLLKFFNGISPLDWFGLLIILGNKVCDSLFQRLETLKVIRLQALPLQNTKPNLNLIQTGSIGY